MRALPTEIGQLTSLERLWVAGDQLTALPDWVGQLTNLFDLDLSGNQLRDLPAEPGRLTNLQVLRLDGNPFQEPLASLVPQGIGAVLAYLRSLLPPPGP